MLIEANSGLFYGQIAPPTAAGRPNSEQGCRDLLERACAGIETALMESGTFSVIEFKEKFGALRF